MYFYRLMSKEELKEKKIHNNRNNFSYYINTHKYKKNKKYVHLFLNAESEAIARINNICSLCSESL